MTQTLNAPDGKYWDALNARERHIEGEALDFNLRVVFQHPDCPDRYVTYKPAVFYDGNPENHDVIKSAIESHKAYRIGELVVDTVHVYDALVASTDAYSVWSLEGLVWRIKHSYRTGGVILQVRPDESLVDIQGLTEMREARRFGGRRFNMVVQASRPNGQTPLAAKTIAGEFGAEVYPTLEKASKALMALTLSY